MSYNYDKLNTLVTLAQNGNQEVFDEIYRLIHPIMRIQASSLLHDEHDVQDVVQEAFIRIWNNIDKVGEPQYFIPWAKKVTTNLSITYLKRNREFTSDNILLYLEENTEPIKDVLEDYIAIERNQDMQDILNELDPIIGTTLYLRYFKGLSLKEISAQLEIPEGTVKSRLHSGKRQLKQLIKNDKRFRGLFTGLIPVGLILTEKSGSNVTLASTSNKILTGVAVTSVSCAVTVAAFYGTEDNNDQSLLAPPSSVTQILDESLPILELISYNDSALSVRVSDMDSGINFNKVYCELKDGQLVGPTKVDVATGEINFVTTGEDVLLHLYDIAGNSICQQLVVQ